MHMVWPQEHRMVEVPIIDTSLNGPSTNRVGINNHQNAQK